jgi:hypothetical protein
VLGRTVSNWQAPLASVQGYLVDSLLGATDQARTILFYFALRRAALGADPKTIESGGSRQSG